MGSDNIKRLVSHIEVECTINGVTFKEVKQYEDSVTIELNDSHGTVLLISTILRSGKIMISILNNFMDSPINLLVKDEKELVFEVRKYLNS